MYMKFFRRLCQTYVSSNCIRGYRYISPFSPSCQRFLEVPFIHLINPIQILYSSNISYQKRDSAILCKNKMASIVSYEQLLQDLENPDVLIIDVRKRSEINETGTLPNSINIPVDDVKNVFEGYSEEQFQEKFGKFKPTKERKIIFSCQSGKRSASAQDIVQKLGYIEAYNYSGGWLEWEKKKKAEGR